MSLLSRLAVQAARAYGILSSGRSVNVPVSYLVVAGGGGGGFDIGGGGGAGGLLASTATLSTLNTYSITVGAGGNGSSSSAAKGSNGANSVISGTGLSTVTSTGGGGGGTNNTGLYIGSTGGSGGGSSAGSTSSASGTAGQGNAGGAGNGNLASGGGGGAGAAGAAGTGVSASGNGGNGSASSISGSSVTYAGGGGGGGYSASASVGTGGTGGGGAGVKTGTAVSGTVNLGGGGGGGGNVGGAGGSGIVIISYTSATPKFVGGTLTTSGGNQIHTFTSSGTLSPLTPVTASYLVVAGGGGAGAANGGGGGAGGLLTSSTTLYSGATYVVTVGAGGGGGAHATGTGATNGGNSVLSGTGITTITATGGGRGGSYAEAAASGGSGGGASNGTNTGGAGTSGQGNKGGDTSTTNPFSAAGGGGAGAAGANVSGSASASSGGIGLTSSITGTSTYYAGGGGGGSNGGTASSGGLGGGGAGAVNNPGVPGTANTGGGGGGSAGSNNGATGGSGTVIISYAGSQVFNGGLVTSSGGNTIHTFNATGALTPVTNNLTNSLRFRGSASAYLSRTPTLTGNQKTWTWSGWVKRGSLAAVRQGVFVAQVSGGVYWGLEFDASNALNIYDSNAGGSTALTTTQVFRDPSAWYHIVVAVDTTQATAANRTKLYINGNQVTAFSVANYPTQNSNTQVNTGSLVHDIGNWNPSVSNLPFDGYMDDINFIDGQALEPYYFGNNDANGVWKPIKYTGMYGTNGFYLTFADTTSTTTLGYDSSGNNNNWTTNNISLTAGVTYDAMLDVPTNTSATVANYAVMNPLELGDGAPAALSNGNLTITGSASLFLRRGTMNFPLTGKYYCEFTITAVGSGVSIAYDSRGQGAATQFIQYDNGGTKNVNGTTTSYGASFTTGDVIAMAVDADGGSIAFYKNNTSQGSITFSSASMTGVNATAMVFAFTSAIVNANFGQRPFAYTPPSGFVALNTFNLPTPTILQGNKYFDSTLYTQNGAASNVIVNQGQFKPDLVWIKCRSNAGTFNNLVDSVRGASKALYSNSTSAEGTDNFISTFNSNGFTLNIGDSGTNNTAGRTQVAWNWQAGQSSGSSNTSGSITSTVSVSTTAGFSVVTWTGNGTIGATIGHGLGVAPSMIIVKQRSGTESWPVYHISLGATKYLNLNQTMAAATSITRWNNTTPSSTVITLYNDAATNGSGSTYVAYCWAATPGFSAFGSYTGNGSTDGPFVYLGFRPEFVMIKTTNQVNEWIVVDSARATSNVIGNYLLASTSAAEDSGYTLVDFVSNGFKMRNSFGGWNGSGENLIYMAFAENPFKNANAR
jgi:hypothetical protein